MTIESSKYQCKICRKETEIEYIKTKSPINQKLHICSVRCFKMYQCIMNSSQKVSDGIVLKLAQKSTNLTFISRF